jgi:FtsH-binding integral membrane protein
VGTLKTLGIIYVIFFILSLLGLTVLGDSASGWLYLVLGVVMVIIAFSGKKGGSMAAPGAAPQM